MRIPFQLTIAALLLGAGLLLSFAKVNKLPADPTCPTRPSQMAWVDSVFATRSRPSSAWASCLWWPLIPTRTSSHVPTASSALVRNQNITAWAD